MERLSTLGDRAVAIAGILAILLTGFFGAAPERETKLLPAASTMPGAQPAARARSA